MPKPLTERQQAIYDFIANAIRSRGAPPTIREIMDVFKINSTNGVRTTLAALEKKGHIRRHARLSRGIELVDYLEPEPLSADLREVPLIGRVAAGAPILATQNIESTLKVDKSLIPASGDIFALRVHGESMRNAGILDGDIVLARQQESAERGDIVVALLGDEATVKTLYLRNRGGRIELRPENPDYHPLVPDPDEVQILGKVVEVRRLLEGGV